MRRYSPENAEAQELAQASTQAALPRAAALASL